MESFNKEDLKYNYNWNACRREIFHIYTEDIIDRKNGEQMLLYFNQFLKLHGLFSHSSINRLEELVYKHMPKQVNTMVEANTWVGQNWNRHFN